MRKPFKIEPGDTWKCECGEEKKPSLYVAAHWDESLTHECECGRKYNLRSGVVRLIKSPKKKSV